MDATQVASWWLLKMRIKLKEKIHLYSSEASPTSTKFMTSLQCKYCNPEQLKWNYLDRKIFYLLFWAHIRPQDLNTPLQTKPKFRCDCLLHNYRKIPHFPLAHHLPGKFQRSLMLLLQRSYSLKNAGIWTVVAMIIYLAHSNYYFFFFFTNIYSHTYRNLLRITHNQFTIGTECITEKMLGANWPFLDMGRNGSDRNHQNSSGQHTSWHLQHIMKITIFPPL